MKCLKRSLYVSRDKMVYRGFLFVKAAMLLSAIKCYAFFKVTGYGHLLVGHQTCVYRY
jgi:hypothetical protein